MSDKPIKIERGIPVPTSRGKRGKELPFDQMKIGDSFFVAIEDGADRTLRRNKITQACSQRKRRDPTLNYTTAWVEGGVRVWRIKP